MLTRFPSPAHSLFWAGACACVVFAVGCRKHAKPESKGEVRPQAGEGEAAPGLLPSALDGLPLDLIPAEAETYAGIDFDRFRDSSHWARLQVLATREPADQARLAEFIQRTGLDPMADIARVFLAFPRDARVEGAFLAVVDGRGFDERRLIAYAREQAKARGEDLKLIEKDGVHLWTGRADTRLVGYFVGRERFVLGGAGWAERAAASTGSGNPSVSSARVEILRLAARVRAGSGDEPPAIWFVSLVPAELRRLLGAEEDAAAAAVMRWGAAVFLGPGLRLYLRAELTHAEAAERLAARCAAFLREKKGSPAALFWGLGSYLAGIRVHANGPDLELSATLTEPEVERLIERLVTVASARDRAARRSRTPR